MSLLKHATLAAALLATSALVSACGGTSATQSVTKAATHKSGFMGLSTTAKVTENTPAAFKGLNKVVIGSFAVGFDTLSTDSNKAGGGLMGSGFGGKSTAKAKLEGVDHALMQSITDTAYKNFVGQLKAAGYEVVDRSVLLNSPQFSKATSYDNPYTNTDSTILATKGATTYVGPTGFSKLYSFQGDMGVMGGFAFSNASLAASTFADAEKIPVISVNYRLDFANTDGHGGWARTTSSIQVGQGLSVVPIESKLGVIGGQAGTFSTKIGSLAIGQPISSDKAFADVVDTTTGADKGMQIAANVIGVIGGVGTNSKRNYALRARPDDYKAAANEILEQANTALISKMQSLR